MTDADIAKVENYLGIKFDEKRREILRSNECFDVQACPGSGKTTLLVAKLAVLADKWPYSRRGICVLSHTNVARQEIEQKLGGTPIGQRLLAYPHFVGTIQGFINEFLALPLLRSEGYHTRLIDNDACFEWVKQRLNLWSNRKQLGNLPRKERTLDGGIRNLIGAGEAIGPNTVGGITDNQWRVLCGVKAEATKKGLWYYDDMFAWADKLLVDQGNITEFARWRFPAIFIDEMQDTSEHQGVLLNKIFPAYACNLRQRFGDSNQAIYDSGQLASTTDPFPADGYRSLPNSQRFGKGVAQKAHSLAPDPPAPVLSGEGPNSRIFPHVFDTAHMPHTIFLFEPDSVSKVLPGFGKLLLGSFPDEVLRCEAFLARAIGRVGKLDESGEKVPKHLGDYWNNYESRSAKPDPRPQYFSDYIHVAQRRGVSNIDCAESVKMVVKGICVLIDIVRPTTIPRSGQMTQWLWKALEIDESSCVLLRNLLWEWCVESTPIVEKLWFDKTEQLRRALHPIIGKEWSGNAAAFCQWSMEYAEQSSCRDAECLSTPNRYRFLQDSRYVDIEMGTIHSAKGQTHTATLVVESYFKKHDMEDLLQWLSGEKCGSSKKEGKERTERMRLIYTAMTRPSHLLCLAMRRSVLELNGKQSETRQRLEQLGWNIKVLDSESK
ncbi:MAG: UvrD-helicase domain-containing protein [Gammaproteobacteria bacterium]|nr:UvrD-helicase domain-containing protein [Gammaproteobacteria bacterium]